jgi:PAS domain S-box-containing protein
MTGVRILIAEDDRVVARDIAEHLVGLGYAVAGVTHSGEESVRLAEELRPELVLMDIRLEGPTDGIEAAQRIRDRSQLPVVFLTAYADEETLRRAKVTEPFGYVLKPFEDRELRTVIEMALYKHEAERRLRISERRYAVTLSSIGDAVIATDGGARVTFANPTAQALTGWPPGEAVGRPLTDVFRIVNEETRQPVEDPAAKVLRLGTVVGLANHTVLVARDGREVPIDDSGAPIIDDKGAVTGTVLVFHDVTEKRRAEEALTLFRTLVDRTNDAIEVIDPATGRFLDVNEKAPLAHGYTREEYLALGLADVEGAAPPRPDPPGEAADADPLMFEGVRRRKDGSTFPVEVNVNRIRLGRDYLVAVVRDISVRKRREEELRLSRQRYETLVNTIDGIVWEADPETFRFRFVSSRAERLLGYPLSQWVAEPTFWVDHLHPDDRERAVADCLSATAEHRDHDLTYRMVAADGREVWLHDAVNVVTEGGRATALRGVMVDVTREKRLEAQFLQSQKMEAVGRLAGGVAHDFNNLLTVITGYCDMLLADLAPGDGSRPMIEEVRKAGERAVGLTRQLLAFSRKQVLKLKPLSLNGVVAGMRDLVSRLIGEDIALVTRLDPGAGSVMADLVQLEQVVLNLAVNARDAMPDGGKLTLQTANAELGEAYARDNPEARPGRYVLLAVTDTGSGMDAATRARVFEPFFTTKEVGKGTGLGLATVYGIITQCGGHVALASEPGRGSTFNIYLPRVEERPAEAAAGPDRPRVPEGREVVLLVEDDASVRGLASRVLRMHGYTVLEAADGPEALRVCERHKGPLHMLVTDVVMPHMNGRQLADRLKALRPDLKVLYVSGYTDDAVLRRGLLEERIAFLSKPFSPDALARAVREVLDRGSDPARG